MSVADEHRRLSEDARYELSSNAAAAERRNRPTKLLWVSGAVLALGMLWMLLGLLSHSSAQNELASEMDARQRIAEMAAEVERIQVSLEADTGGSRGYERVPDFLSQTQAAGREAGLTRQVRLPEERVGSEEDGLVPVEWTFELRDPELEALLEWVELCMERVPGLRVSSVEIQPRGDDWSFRVVYSRWERRG